MEHKYKSGIIQYSCIGLFYVNLTQVRVIGEEEVSNEKMPPSGWAAEKPIKHFLI